MNSPAQAAPLVAKAILLMREGLWQDAAFLLETHLLRCPDDADALNLAGLTHSNGGGAAAALPLFERAIALDPAFAPYHVNLGTTLRQLGRRDQAAAAFGRALDLAPDLPEPALALAAMLAEDGRGEEALSWLERVLTHRPDHVEARALLCRTLSHLGRHDAALEQARRLEILAPDNAAALIQAGTALLRHGDPAQAARVLGRAAAMRPEAAEVLNLWAIALKDSGQSGDALAVLDRAIALRPDWAPLYNTRGNALKLMGQPDAALAAFDTAVALDPAYADAHNNRGLMLRDRRRLDDALAAFRQACACAPDSPDILSNLGTVLCDAGHPAEAVAVLEQVVALRPAMAAGWNNLALACSALGRRAEAEAHFRRGLDHDPGNAALYNNLGLLLIGCNRFDEAEATLKEALRLTPRYKEAWQNLGFLMQIQGRLPDSVFALHQALDIDPDYAAAIYSLGVVRREQCRHGDAERLARKAIALDPADAAPHNNLGIALMEMGRIDEALASYEAALQRLEDARFRSNLLFCMAYSDRLGRGEQFEAHRHFDRIHGTLPDAPGRPHANDRDPGRVLRIGYVSGDFRWHSVSYFIEPLLRAHHRDRVHVTCYSLVARPDSFTERLRGIADGWRDIGGLTDDDAAALIRADGIDILVDLAGHTAHNRMTLFVRRPAPVQVTWLGYPATTGLGAMDWRVTDAVADPHGDGDAFHSERLYRLPGCFLCYHNPEQDMPVAPPSFHVTGNITFGSFNNLAKMSPGTYDAWARILHAVPGTGLLLKSKALSDEAGRDWVLENFARRGIGPGRLALVSFAATARDHLSRYGAIDIALDTFPYNGTTTTCEALWMGVPVLTLRGDRHAARVGASLLTALGLEDLIAADADDYVARAAALAADKPRLERLRAELRGRMQASALCDPDDFARRMEQAYRDMWQSWCAGPVTFEKSARPPA